MTFLSCNTLCLSLPEAFLSIWVSTLFFHLSANVSAQNFNRGNAMDVSWCAEGVRQSTTNCIVQHACVAHKSWKFQQNILNRVAFRAWVSDGWRSRAPKARGPNHAAAASTRGPGPSCLLQFFVDILHFCWLSPVAAAVNKSLSASAAWNCARAAGGAAEAPERLLTLLPRSRRLPASRGFQQEAWAQPGRLQSVQCLAANTLPLINLRPPITQKRLLV